MKHEPTTYLYGDNCECLGEIDEKTLAREWNYLQQFQGIFSPHGAAASLAKDSIALKIANLKIS